MKILKFYGESCQPCRMMIPVLNKVSDDLDIEVEEIDTEEQPEKTSEFSIQKLPTFVMLSESGDERGRVEGALPLAKFLERVEDIYGLV